MVLVLTSGRRRARRKAEWWRVFATPSRATVRRLEVLDCLDSGVVVRRDDEDGRTEEERPQLSNSVSTDDFESVSTDDVTSRQQDDASTIDVLHGVPHEAILDYVAANGIDSIVIRADEMARLDRSFVGSTFRTISRVASVPVTVAGETVGPRGSPRDDSSR